RRRRPAVRSSRRAAAPAAAVSARARRSRRGLPGARLQVTVLCPMEPVTVTVSDADAAELLTRLLDDYFAVLGAGDEGPIVQVEPIDDTRRSVVLYRVIQASRTVADRYPEAKLYLLTEEGSRWRLPPPAL